MFDLNDMPGWPKDAPNHLSGVLNLTGERIAEICTTQEERDTLFGVRAQLADLTGAHQGRKPLRHWGDFFEAFRDRVLIPPSFWQLDDDDAERTARRRPRWLVYPLGADRRPLTRAEQRGRPIHVEVYRHVPQRRELPAISTQGVYVLVWTGTPAVLSNDRYGNDVRERLTELLAANQPAAAPVCDVLFAWFGDLCQPRLDLDTLWSLRSLTGKKTTGEHVEFRDAELAASLHTWT